MSDGLNLRIERTFQAPAAKVFEDWETTEAKVDLRLGSSSPTATSPTRSPPWAGS